MAYDKKQHKPSWFVANNVQKKSLFQPPQFPDPRQNVTTPPPKTDKTKYRQPKPREMIKNVLRSMDMDESIYPLIKEEGIQKQETTQTEYKLPRQLKAPPRQDSRIINPPWLTEKQLLAPKRADRTYRPPVNQLNAPQLSSTSNGKVIQAKLTIGEPNDKYEQEADRVAAKVVQQINHPAPVSMAQDEQEQGKERVMLGELSMKPMPVIREVEAMEEGEDLQMKSILRRREAIVGREVSTDLETAINRARGGGQPLNAGLQQSMGQAMGADFSGVKIHTDTTANKLSQSIQAQAFTTGQDVFFKQGSYNPHSQQGQQLIAHELTHVMQQNNGQHLQADKQSSKNTAKLNYERSKHSGSIQRTVTKDSGAGNYAADELWSILEPQVRSEHSDLAPEIIPRLERLVKYLAEHSGGTAASGFDTVYTLSEVQAALMQTIEEYKQWSNIGDRESKEWGSEEKQDDSALSEESPSFEDIEFLGERVIPFEPRSPRVLENPKWIEIKFHNSLAQIRGEGEKRQRYKPMADNEIICAVSAAALVTGFVPTPPEFNKIVILSRERAERSTPTTESSERSTPTTESSGRSIPRPQRIPMVKQIAIGSKKMTELLHFTGGQPTFLSAEQAHAISMRFSPLFGTQVSPVYSVNFFGEGETKTKDPSRLLVLSRQELSKIVSRMQVQDRIYVGKKGFDNETNEPSLKGHAIAGIRLKNGIRWFGTNQDLQQDDTLELTPSRAGYKFEYYIVRGGSPYIVESNETNDSF